MSFFLGGGDAGVSGTTGLVQGLTPNTDISFQVQEAIDSMSNSGGGTVVLPAGTFYLSDGLEMKPYVTLMGQGSCKTVLQWLDGIDPEHYAEGLIYNGFGPSKVVVQGLSLIPDTPSGTITNAPGLVFNNVFICSVIDVTVTDSYGAGFVFINAYQQTIKDCTTYFGNDHEGSFGGHGIYIQGGYEFLIENLYSMGNDGNALSVNSCSNITISNSQLIDSNIGAQFAVTDNIMISNVVSDSMDNSGFWIEGSTARINNITVLYGGGTTGVAIKDSDISVSGYDASQIGAMAYLFSTSSIGDTIHASGIIPGPDGINALDFSPGAIYINPEAPTRIVSSNATTHNVSPLDVHQTIFIDSVGCSIFIDTDTNIPLPIGTEISFVQAGDGQLVVSGAMGVALFYNTYWDPVTRGPGSPIKITKFDADAWLVTGDLVVD